MSDMKLHLLGTTGYHPSERRHTACLMLPELGIVLDAGTGLFRVRDRLATSTLDIFLTHAHLDHVVGLTYLFDVLFEKSVERVTVHGEAEKLAAVEEHLFCEPLFPVSPPCDFRPLTADHPLPDGGHLTSFPLDHPGGSRGFRLDWPGHSMAYVTDTTARADADYVEKIRGVDLLVHECYFADDRSVWAAKTGHSCTTPVAEVARACGAGRLILVHVNPLDDFNDPVQIDVARAIFPEVQYGEDGMIVEF